ncbi:Chitin binding protein [Methanosarcina barkeri 3]|uniref:Chitin binding protein n=1 Tax=Methanosarcina barkeri 3 TaxID=1434107 RepID=A0A0E3SGE9_METBA|nr:hypothetical protein [Methanosarcina barkeri]AKB81519.1 Chitin binding protein [Methanosarcina barkeri 3]
MDKEDSNNSIWKRVKSMWNSLPELLKLLGTILSIAIALKALFPAAAVGISNFDASPEIIGSGGSSVLNWEVSGANNITIEPGIGPVSSNGSMSVSPLETTTYKLIANDKGNEKVALCTVTVNNGSQEPLLISSFDASPDTIKPGESAILNWHVSGVSNVTIEPDIGVVEPTGTLSVSPTGTTTYKLTASSGEKEDASYCTVAVEENAASSENVSASNLPSTEESLTSQESSSIKENPTSEDNQASNDNEASKDNQASNDNEASKDNQASQESQTSQNDSALQENQTSKESLPSINSFNANPDTIEEGKSSKLVWRVSGASKVSIKPGIGTVGLTGSQSISPSKTMTYTLTATNEFGSAEATKVVLVQESSASSSQKTDSNSNTSTSTQEQPSSTNETKLNSSGSGTGSSTNETQ